MIDPSSTGHPSKLPFDCAAQLFRRNIALIGAKDRFDGSIATDDVREGYFPRGPKLIGGSITQHSQAVVKSIRRLECISAIMTIISAQTDDRHATPLKLARQGIERRHLGATGRAPAGPEIEHHHVATQGGQINGLAIELTRDQRRRGLAHGGHGAGHGRLQGQPPCQQRDRQRGQRIPG